MSSCVIPETATQLFKAGLYLTSLLSCIGGSHNADLDETFERFLWKLPESAEINILDWNQKI